MCSKFSHTTRICGIRFLTLILFTAALLPLAGQPAPKKPTDRPSVALVLSGGGAKGFAHIPVLELIEELDIPIDMIIGNSAGSIVGGLYCAGYTPYELKTQLADFNWVEIFNDHPEFPLENELGEHSVYAKPINLKFNTNFSPDLGKGFAIGERAYALLKTLTAKIPSYIDFDSLPIPFRAVAVNMVSGELEVFGKGDLAEAIRASISLPAVFEPFPIDGKYYLDGVVRNNTPIEQAKELGYDIIIVVEIYGETNSDYSDFDTSSSMSIPEVFNIYLYSLNSRQQEYADVILYPDLKGFTMFDFPKAIEIYNRGAEQKVKFRDALLDVRKKIYPDQYKNESATPESALRIDVDGSEHTFSLVSTGGLPPSRSGYYSKLPDITVYELTIHGAVPSDEQYIEMDFLKIIAGIPLTKENLLKFINSVYKTGNYTFVIIRTDLRYSRPTLELILHQNKHENIRLLLGGSFQTTISSDSINKLSISTDLQFRGLTGPGSVLVINTDVVNKTAAEIVFMQPFNPRVYATITANIRMDQDFISTGFATNALAGNRIVTAGAQMKIGIRFNDYHSLTTGPALTWMNTDEGFTEALSVVDRENPDSRANIAVPYTVSYIFSTLNYQALPTSGYYVRITDTVVFPFASEETPIAYNISELDLSSVIPVSKRFSVATSIFAGTDITQNLQNIPYQVPVFGYNSFDRMYFPHIAGKKMYGTHKGAAQLFLLFQPWENVTILGGQVVFSVSMSIGELAMRYEDFNKENIIWCTSFNIGLRTNKAFGAQFRIGAGSFNQKIMPFLSFDVGTLRF